MRAPSRTPMSTGPPAVSSTAWTRTRATATTRAGPTSAASRTSVAPAGPVPAGRRAPPRGPTRSTGSPVRCSASCCRPTRSPSPPSGETRQATGPDDHRTRRISRVTSEARPREEEVVTSSSLMGGDVDRPRAGTGTGHAEAPVTPGDPVALEVPAGAGPRVADEADDGARTRKGRRARRGSRDGERRRGSPPSLPLVPTLAVVLALLLGGIAFLWFSRPDSSAVRTGHYVAALQAARSGVVALTSFDYLTLDDDIEQVRRVATGDLRDEAVRELDDNRDQITQAEAVVNTEVVGAGVTRADAAAATVLLVIRSTQESNASEQAQVVRYRIEVELEKSGSRWLLSGIKGTGTDG